MVEIRPSLDPKLRSISISKLQFFSRKSINDFTLFLPSRFYRINWSEWPWHRVSTWSDRCPTALSLRKTPLPFSIGEHRPLTTIGIPRTFASSLFASTWIPTYEICRFLIELCIAFNRPPGIMSVGFVISKNNSLSGRRWICRSCPGRASIRHKWYWASNQGHYIIKFFSV